MEDFASMKLPRARKDDLVVEEVFDELVIYDLKQNRVHSLNPTAALIWQHCDGHTTPVEMLTLLEEKLDAPVQDDLVWYTLERLEKARLLEESAADIPSSLSETKITRRQALRKLGIAVAMVPVVTTIVAPQAAQAASSACPSGQCKCILSWTDWNGNEHSRDKGCQTEEWCKQKAAQWQIDYVCL